MTIFRSPVIQEGYKHKLSTPLRTVEKTHIYSAPFPTFFQTLPMPSPPFTLLFNSLSLLAQLPPEPHAPTAHITFYTHHIPSAPPSPVSFLSIRFSHSLQQVL